MLRGLPPRLQGVVHKSAALCSPPRQPMGQNRWLQLRVAAAASRCETGSLAYSNLSVAVPARGWEAGPAGRRCAFQLQARCFLRLEKRLHAPDSDGFRFSVHFDHCVDNVTIFVELNDFDNPVWRHALRNRRSTGRASAAGFVGAGENLDDVVIARIWPPPSL